MRYVSVCAGIEAATVAWHDFPGWEPVLFSDIEPFPRALLQHHYPDVPLIGDFTELIATPPKADLLVGGTPCQAFSIAGKRLSLEDYRGNLSLAFADLAHAMEVPYVLWENVPGVLSTKDNAFGCFLGRLVGEEQPLVPDGGKWDNAGLVVGPAYTAAWRVLDAQYFGVAQRRRRVFVFACRGAGNWAAPGVLFPVAEGVRGDPAPRREAGKDPAGTLASRTSAGGGLGTDFDCAGGVVAHPLKAEGADGSEDGTGRGVPLVVQEYLGNAEGGAEEVPFLTSANVGKCVNNQTPLVGVASPVPIAMRQREGKPGGGKGPLLSANVSLTLAAGGNDQTIFAPDLAPTVSQGPPFSGTGNERVECEALVVVIQERAVSENPDNGPQGAGFRTDGVAYTIEARHHVQAVAAAFDVRNVTSKANRTRVEDGLPTPTLHSKAMHVIALRPRRLTPRECERLQGFPDDYTLIPWKKGMSPDSLRYRALGNSMAVPVMRWIGHRIREVCQVQTATEKADAPPAGHRDERPPAGTHQGPFPCPP